jgi:hypothetical protein
MPGKGMMKKDRMAMSEKKRGMPSMMKAKGGGLAMMNKMKGKGGGKRKM